MLWLCIGIKLGSDGNFVNIISYILIIFMLKFLLFYSCEYFMAGHSRWSNIKHRKKTNDDKKSKLFSKLTNDIKVSLQEGSSDVKNNYKLKNAILRAMDNNVSKTVIDNIIYKSSSNACDRKLYAGFGAHGSVFIVDCMVSNNNKILSDLRCLFSKYSGSLTSVDSILYLFNKFYRISLIDNYNSDVLFFGFPHVFTTKFLDDSLCVDFDAINDVKALFFSLNIKAEFSIFFVPKVFLKLEDSFFDKMYSFKDTLEKQSYVVNVFTNIECVL